MPDYQRPQLPYIPDPVLRYSDRYVLTAQSKQSIGGDQLDGEINYLIFAANDLSLRIAETEAGILPGSNDPLNTLKFPTTDGAGNIFWTKVTAAYMAALCVSEDSLQDGCVTENKIGDAEITNEKLTESSVKNNVIDDNDISFDKIKDENNVHFQQFFNHQDDASLNLSKILINAGSISGLAITINTLPAAAVVNNSLTNAQLAPVIQLRPGMMMDWAPGGAAPAGWLLASGQPVNRITYALLFAAIGTTYGIGDGVTTFNLPDTRGRIIAGIDPTSGQPTGGRIVNNTPVLGGVGGAETHTLTVDQTPAHTHGISVFSKEGTLTYADVSVGVTFGLNTRQTTSIGGGQAHNNMSPYLLMPKIIYAGV